MFIDFRTQKSDVTSANDSKKWPRKKGKFFRGIILRQLSVLLMNISKKKGQRYEVINKFDVSFYKIHEI